MDEAAAALECARAYLRAQGLTAQPRRAPQGARGGSVGASAELAELCAVCLVPAGAQRDLFQDSALTAAENSLKEALAARQLGEARESLTVLRQLRPPHATDGYERLIEAAEPSAMDAAAEVRELEDVVTPLAAKLLGHCAFAYMAGLWQSLARRLDETPFVPATPNLHSSYADARAGQWRRVIDDVESARGWREQPALVARLAEAHARSSDRQAARRLWALLCWTHPTAARAELDAGCADPLLARLWHEFRDTEPELATCDFPAWLLIADSFQRGFVPPSVVPDSAAGRAYAAMYRVTSNADDIDARRELSAYSGDLLQHYFKRRGRARR